MAEKRPLCNYSGQVKELISDDSLPGISSYCYIAYASDSNGTGFTTTFNASLDYIAIKTTTSPISNPQASDFTGLWKNYKGTAGTDGADGQDANVYYGTGDPPNPSGYSNGSIYFKYVA